MREKLAESAFTLLSERGFQAVTLDEIAAHGGVTKGSLYWHYHSKKELVLEACAFYYRRWQREAHAAIAKQQGPAARLEQAVRYSVEKCLFDAANRRFTMDVMVLAMQDDEVRAGWSQFYDTCREFFIGLVEAVRQAGQIRTKDPRRAVDLMLAALEGIKLRAAFDPHLCSPRQREETVSEMLQILSRLPQDVARPV